jgi:hypothetical protein
MEDGMVTILFPRDEAELSLAITLLETHSIPLFVRNDSSGGSDPGAAPGAFGVRAVKVPFHQAARARDLLMGLPPAAPGPSESGRSGLWGRLGRALRTLLPEWFGPGLSVRRSRRRP